MGIAPFKEGDHASLIIVLNVSADLAELHTLLKSAVREANRKLLGDAIVAANAALATASGSDATATAAPASSLAPPAASPPAPVTVSAPVPLAVSAPVPLAVTSTVASGAAAPATWFDEPSYGWSEAGDFIEVLVTDERLRGVGALPKEAVTCDFTESSFDLKVRAGLQQLLVQLVAATLTCPPVACARRFLGWPATTSGCACPPSRRTSSQRTASEALVCDAAASTACMRASHAAAPLPSLAQVLCRQEPREAAPEEGGAVGLLDDAGS